MSVVASGDAELLRQIDSAFGAVERPAHFTDFTHCCECAEHDELLRSRDRRSLRIEDVGNPGWDPLCFCSAQGIAYFFPALARLALVEGETSWYGEQLHFHLSYDGRDNRLLRYCDPAQRVAVAGLLAHLLASRGQRIASYSMDNDFRQCLAMWSDGSTAEPA
jgi:hypothetical protein